MVWSLLVALIACSVAGAWHVPAVREEPLALAAAVALVACQACIGATVVLDRPVWSWRTAATVDVSAAPTLLAVWVSIEADVWPWTVAGVAHAVLWIAVAAAVCPSPVREGRSA